MLQRVSIDRAVQETVEVEAALVIAAARSKPKAWGALAARGVVQFRALTGRRAADQGRRGAHSARSLLRDWLRCCLLGPALRGG